MTEFHYHLPTTHFDLALSLESGQVFHWTRVGEHWHGLIADAPVILRQEGDLLTGRGLATPEALAAYLALDHPMRRILRALPRDPHLKAAGAYCGKLRLLRQPAWECLATFITSAVKQVPHIAQISGHLRRNYGQPIPFAGQTWHTYPTPAALAAASEADLRTHARLGWRAPNLRATAAAIAEGRFDLQAPRTLPIAEARKYLCTLPGVGEKVANCVLLFAYERLEAFPVDVWIERMLRELYFPAETRATATAGEIRAFAAAYFGPYGGYAQQLLFHHARLGGALEKPAPKKTPKKPTRKVDAAPPSM
jgi:N-glycosylase/DNA lyase